MLGERKKKILAIQNVFNEVVTILTSREDDVQRLAQPLMVCPHLETLSVS